MKKTLIAAALCSMAAGAMAANVTVYGVIDEALHFQSVKSVSMDGVDMEVGTKKYSAATAGATLSQQEKKNVLQFLANGNSTSRIGFKAEEELGSGVKVGCVFENSFLSDTGVANANFFDRESSIWISSQYGKVLFGRLGSLKGATGSVALLGGFGPFSTGWDTMGVGADKFGDANGRKDNSIAYQSPKMAGFDITLMYSFGVGENDKLGQNANDNYMAAGFRYANGPFGALAIAEMTEMANDAKDPYHITLGAYYDFGAAKLQGTFHVADHSTPTALYGAATAAASGVEYQMNEWTGATIIKPSTGGYATYTPGTALGKDTKGIGGEIGVTIPFGAANLLAAVDYYKAEVNGSVDDKLTRVGAAVGGDYTFSKTFKAYGVVAYATEKYEWKTSDAKAKALTAMVGLIKNF